MRSLEESCIAWGAYSWVHPKFWSRTATHSEWFASLRSFFQTAQCYLLVSNRLSSGIGRLKSDWDFLSTESLSFLWPVGSTGATQRSGAHLDLRPCKLALSSFYRPDTAPKIDLDPVGSLLELFSQPVQSTFRTALGIIATRLVSLSQGPLISPTFPYLKADLRHPDRLSEF